MNSLRDTQRTNVIKFIHDWQNTGKQFLQFQEIEADKPDDHAVYTEVHIL